MPQDGSNNYYYPPGTPGIPDTTIESEAYNTFLDDLVVNDLNIPRPIHRGGTGANNADAALVNLKGEKAGQVVTAYLSHVWMSGSFRSTAGATDAPVAGHTFAGICYINEPFVFPPDNQNVIIEARDQNDTLSPGRVYIREKKLNVWGPWLCASEMSVGTTPPTGVPDGTLFWDNDTGVLYVYYNDGDSTQWVQASAVPVIDYSALDTPDDGQFYARQNDVWVPVPRYQRVSVVGGHTFDVTVPAGAIAVRLNGVLFPSTAIDCKAVVQVSVSAGVFRSTPGDYVMTGFYHASADTVISPIQSTTETGFLLAGTHGTGVNTPIIFDGTIALKRPGTGGTFSGDFRGRAHAPSGATHSFFFNFIGGSASGAALDVLALRFTNTSSDNWASGSSLVLEWL